MLNDRMELSRVTLESPKGVRAAPLELGSDREVSVAIDSYWW